MRLNKTEQKLLDVIRVTGGKDNVSQINPDLYTVLTGSTRIVCQRAFAALVAGALVSEDDKTCGTTSEGIARCSDTATLKSIWELWQHIKKEDHKKVMTKKTEAKKPEKKKAAPKKKAAAKKPTAKKAPAKKKAAKKPAAKKATVKKTAAKKEPEKKVASKAPKTTGLKQNGVAYPRETSAAYVVWKTIEKLRGRKKNLPGVRTITVAVLTVKPEMRAASIPVYIHTFKKHHGII